MSAALPLEPIDVEALRVGMYVHLDVGWMSHPFPLSNFRIDSAQQLATIRGLGLKRVRWSPRQSQPLPDPATPHVTLTPGTEPAAAAGTDTPGAAAAAEADAGAGELPEVPGAAPAPVESPEAKARTERRRRLTAQREALQVCERQYAEAARDFKRAVELVPVKPAQARADTEALTRALVDKMLGEQELCIRLLSEGSADKASLHSMNVAVISMLMARSFGMAEQDLLDLGVGALLHDVGKLDLPERVRHREDHFSGAEMRFYEEHVAHGVTHARKMGLTPGATLVIAQHHEHADASGFPLKLNADRMTPLARIVSLVNRYDRLCNPVHPAKALTPHESLSLLFAQGKNKFDTAILGAFIKMMGVYPPGSAVQLTDDRFALVVAVNSSRPLKPRVLVHDAGVPHAEALVLDLEAEPHLGIRRSMAPANLPAASLQYLSPRPRVAYFFEPAAPLEATA
jgi:putative nucleotidyltransferase with HDIG domain